MFHIICRDRHGTFTGTDGLRTQAQALARQFLHQINKAFIFLTQQGIGGHAQVVEKQLCGVIGMLTHFFDAFAFLETRQTAVHQKQADALGTFGGVGFCGQYDQATMQTIRNESF